MLHLIALSVLVCLLAIANKQLVEFWFQADAKLEPLEIASWEQTAIFKLPTIKSNSEVNQAIEDYLQRLAVRGIQPQEQGLWFESDWEILVNHQGTQPIAAASLTKIATTLRALGKWGAAYQFVTKIYHTGALHQGVVTGDLIIEGSGDPFFVWEEAISVANFLNQLGVRQIQGDLIVTDRFYMNYQSDSLSAGALLRQSFDHRLWQSEIKQQYQQLPASIPKPRIIIRGQVKSADSVSSNAALLLTHQSLPLGEILRQMNIYSNNGMAEILANLAGGAKAVSIYAAQQAQVPQTEVLLINGSGLGEANRISPRAACKMLREIDTLLNSSGYRVTDLFPVAGRDRVGTVENRTLPQGTAIKTGTLNWVSALAGVTSFGSDGEDKLCFAIINRSNQTEYLRSQQDKLLNQLVEHWQIQPQLARSSKKHSGHLGDPFRNLLPEKN